MAEAIPEDYVLLPNRILIQSEEGSCIGTIIAKGEGWGSFYSEFTTTKVITTESPPENPATEEVEFTQIVFKREGAQEVQIGEEDYLIINCNDVLAFIPPEE